MIKQCKRGHVGERNSYGVCIECKRICAAKEYQRNKANYKKLKAKNYAKKRDELIRYSVEWNKKNKERRKEICGNYYKINKEKVAEKNNLNRDVILAKKRASHSANREARNEKVRIYKKINKRLVNACNASRRAKIRGAEGSFARKDIDDLLLAQIGRCAVCFIMMRDYHVDHIMPIALGGSNFPDNIQLLCPSCNLSKGAKTMSDWIGQNGQGL